MVYKCINFVQKFFYPPLCTLCGAPGSAERDLCEGCFADLPTNHHACLRCGAPLTQSNTCCGPCARQPPPYLSAYIPFRYAAPVDYLLQQLKFHQQLNMAPLLGELMAQGVAQRAAPLPDCLVPVPLHPDRLRERGYNQALELANVLSKRLSIPVQADLCRRRRATAPQTSLDGSERRRNLRGAFAVREGVLPRRVAIVDDVVTTGTTVSELARTLKRAGVAEVEVWACARAGTG